MPITPIYGAGLLLATIARPAGTTTPSVTSIHPDAQVSTNVTTDADANTTELLDYYPYKL